MWMPQSCSQVCVIASSTPYENGATRQEYPAGYGPACRNDMSCGDGRGRSFANMLTI
jgi:hypothetical protein